VNPDAVPDLARADLTAVSANEWLVRNAPMSHGDAVLAAVAAGDDAARLAVAPATPVLSLTRTTWDGDRPITWVRLVFRPGHRFRAELRGGERLGGDRPPARRLLPRARMAGVARAEDAEGASPLGPDEDIWRPTMRAVRAARSRPSR
jgi:hypothetical protein